MRPAAPRRLAGSLGAALCLCGCSAAVPPIPPRSGHPLRVMSINQCTDQLVLALLPPSQIASVTWLSRDPAGSVMAAAAQRVPVNHGTVEDVIRQRPDLVAAGSFTTPATRAMLKRLGYPLIEVESADTFDQIRAITRQVATAVDAVPRSEALIARMDAQLAVLAHDPGPRLRVAAWDGAGFGAAKGSLYDAVLSAAGADNIAALGRGSGPPDAEALLAAAPSLLVAGLPAFHRPGLRDNLARHRVVRRFWGRDRTVTISPASYVCGTPMVAEAIAALRGQLRRAAAAARTPLPFAAGAAR